VKTRLHFPKETGVEEYLLVRADNRNGPTSPPAAMAAAPAIGGVCGTARCAAPRRTVPLAWKISLQRSSISPRMPEIMLAHLVGRRAGLGRRACAGRTDSSANWLPPVDDFRAAESGMRGSMAEGVAGSGPSTMMGADAKPAAGRSVGRMPPPAHAGRPLSSRRSSMSSLRRKIIITHGGLSSCDLAGRSCGFEPAGDLGDICCRVPQRAS